VSLPERDEPTVAQRSPAGWIAWLAELGRAGRARIAQWGLVLVLGFVAAIISLYLFADLSEGVASQETQQLDLTVLEWLRQFNSPTLDLAARVFSALGSEVVAVLLVVLLGVLARRRRWGAAVALLLTTGGAQLLNNVLKGLFERTRPAPVTGLIPVQAFSFPSGHAMVSAAFYFFLAYLGWRVIRGRWRPLWVGALLTLVLLIGLSRLYLGVHYFTDVVAGYLAGFLWTDTVIISGFLLARRRRAATAPAGPADRRGAGGSLKHPRPP
jgi:undecaprenyl-diphosphatase